MKRTLDWTFRTLGRPLKSKKGNSNILESSANSYSYSFHYNGRIHTVHTFLFFFFVKFRCFGRMVLIGWYRYLRKPSSNLTFFLYVIASYVFACNWYRKNEYKITAHVQRGFLVMFHRINNTRISIYVHFEQLGHH